MCRLIWIYDGRTCQLVPLSRHQLNYNISNYCIFIEGLQVPASPGHCVVCMSKTLYPLLSTGSTQEDPSWHDWKNVDRCKESNQTNKTIYVPENLVRIFKIFIPPVYEVYRGYIVFAFSVIMFVCLFVCKLFFPSKISQQLLGLGFWNLVQSLIVMSCIV